MTDNQIEVLLMMSKRQLIHVIRLLVCHFGVLGETFLQQALDTALEQQKTARG